eukprot:704049_1
MTGGIREFLRQRDKKLNWNDYSIPSYDVIPPGCKRLISKHVKRLTKNEYLQVMSQRTIKRKTQSSHHMSGVLTPPVFRPPIISSNKNGVGCVGPGSYSMSDLNRRAPPITATSSLGSMHVNVNGNNNRYNNHNNHNNHNHNNNNNARDRHVTSTEA